jgi:hypothetical protein
VSNGTVRTRLIRWLCAVAIAHLLAGLTLTLMAHLPMFENYHHGIEQAFWPHGVPAESRPQQVWWIRLFGATLQFVAVLMLAMVRVADRVRRAEPWGWLIAGLLLWAPQDMAISASAGIWVHVAIDAVALLVLLPPLVWLYRHDGKALRQQTA